MHSGKARRLSRSETVAESWVRGPAAVASSSSQGASVDSGWPEGWSTSGAGGGARSPKLGASPGLLHAHVGAVFTGVCSEGRRSSDWFYQAPIQESEEAGSSAVVWA